MKLSRIFLSVIVMFFVGYLSYDVTHTADQKVITGLNAQITTLQSRDASWTADWARIQPVLGTYDAYKARAELLTRVADPAALHREYNASLSGWAKVDPKWSAWPHTVLLASVLSESGHLTRWEQEQLAGVAFVTDDDDLQGVVDGLKVVKN